VDVQYAQGGVGGLRTGAKHRVFLGKPAGFISARLLDASGTLPLAGRKVSVEVPGEGKVELETDDAGKVSLPHVPFQDYELELEGGVTVAVPAVGSKSEVHVRHVPDERAAFVNALVRLPWGLALRGAPVKVTFPSGASVEATTSTDGVVECHALEGGEGEAEISCDEGKVRVATAASPQRVAAVIIGAA
jgi:hypothetical protein